MYFNAVVHVFQVRLCG